MIESTNKVVSAVGTALRRTKSEDQGIASSVLLNLIKTLDREVRDIHSLMIVRHGAVVAEAWWSPYRADLPHMLFSLSKSFTSTAIGLAIAEGRLSLDDTVVSFFPDEAPRVLGKNLAALRVRDLLTMTTGNAEDTLSLLFRGSISNWVEAFLHSDFVHFPGTHFVYNSGATYVLSAILQKLTGVQLLDYLEPRFLAPLGIVGATWESSPQGINTGGWGLSLKTEDIARFGQFYLQRGMWHGARILPDAWVREATSKQVPNGDNPLSDWAQGYGFQFWQSRHGAYRGDGACGQFCVVIPEHDVVVAITSGTNDLQAVLEILWQNLLPGLTSLSLPEDRTGSDELAAFLSSLSIWRPEGASSSPIAANAIEKTYRLDSNENGVATVRLGFEEGIAALRLSDAYGQHVVHIGLDGAWIAGETALNTPGYPTSAGLTRAVSASGAWTSPSTFRAKLCFVETPFAATFKLRFENGCVYLDIHSVAGFGPLEWPQLVGRAAS